MIDFKYVKEQLEPVTPKHKKKRRSKATPVPHLILKTGKSFYNSFIFHI